MPVKSGTSYTKLIEATAQRTLPGRQESTPFTQQHFVIVWKHKQKPETFYWRGAEGWANIIIRKVHKRKLKSAPQYELGEKWYDTEEISLNKIKKGDTLQLTPIYGGKNSTPAEIADNVTNRIFFKTKNTGWLYIKVDKFITHPDIIMP